MAKPTIHDVAALAGVSKSVVSLVLQDSPLVKEGKRTAVRQAMADLGYVYNAAAAGLRGKAAAAASVPGAIPLAVDLADAQSAAFAAAMQMAAAEKGLGLYLLRVGEGWVGRRISTRPDDTGDDRTLTALHPLAQARANVALAAARATRHLLGLGAIQVAFVGGDRGDVLDAPRIRGYFQRLARVEVPPLHLAGARDFAFGRAAAAQLLDQHPHCTAALCLNDEVALGLCEALAKRGVVLGDGFRVVGWGNTPMAQAQNLSSIAAPWDELARLCVTWVQNGGAPPPETMPKLMRRASSMGGV